jgi:hypothetical protein
MGVARYSPAFSGEVAFGNAQHLSAEHNEPDVLLQLAWHTVALLKLRTGAAIICPAAASQSWDTVAAASPQTVLFYMLDDVPRQILSLSRGQTVTASDLNWIKAHWSTALELRDHKCSRRFGPPLI